MIILSYPQYVPGLGDARADRTAESTCLFYQYTHTLERFATNTFTIKTNICINSHIFVQQTGYWPCAVVGPRSCWRSNKREICI